LEQIIGQPAGHAREPSSLQN